MYYKKRIGIFLMVFLLCLIGLSGAEKKAEPVGAVVAWTGDVSIFREGEGKKIQVKKMEPLYAADTILTEVNSRAKILMKDDSIISLGQNASVKVKGYVYERKGNFRSAAFRIVSGNVRAIVGSFFRGKGSFFKIETHTAVVGVKGTDFIVATKGKETEIITIGGDVYAANISPSISKEVVVSAGHTSTVAENAPPTLPEPVSEERMDELIEDTAIPVTKPLELAEEGCVSCHNEVAVFVSKQSYQHPDTLNKCAVCHIKENVKESSVNVDSYSTDSLVFLDLKEAMTYKLKVRVKDGRGKEAKSETLEVVPSKVIGGFFADKTPSGISGLRVSEVGKGVFASITLAWKTTKPSLSILEYGDSEKLGNTVYGVPEQYVTEHRLLIDKVQPKEKYYVRAVAEDVSGNKSVSEPIQFKPKNIEAAKPAEAEVESELAVNKISIARVGRRLALMWKTTKPAKTTVMISEVLPKEKIAGMDPHYPGFRNSADTGMNSCELCHGRGTHKRASHPVGTVDWSKATRPADVKLGDGLQMLCSTCHGPHGSGFPHTMRKEEPKLCDSCHGIKR
ncbi:MAG: FecR domain-containing protein [Thermodesulfobacteriota bacterium]